MFLSSCRNCFVFVLLVLFSLCQFTTAQVTEPTQGVPVAGGAPVAGGEPVAGGVPVAGGIPATAINLGNDYAYDPTTLTYYYIPTQQPVTDRATIAALNEAVKAAGALPGVPLPGETPVEQTPTQAQKPVINLQKSASSNGVNDVSACSNLPPVIAGVYIDANQQPQFAFDCFYRAAVDDIKAQTVAIGMAFSFGLLLLGAAIYKILTAEKVFSQNVKKWEKQKERKQYQEQMMGPIDIPISNEV